MERAKANNNIKLSDILELGVQVSFEKLHPGLPSVLFFGDFDQLGRDVVAVEPLDLHAVGLEPFLHVVGLLAITTSHIHD